MTALLLLYGYIFKQWVHCKQNKLYCKQNKKKKDTEDDKPYQPIQSREREGKLAGTHLHSNKRASEEEVWSNNPAPATAMSAGPQP